MSRGLTHRPLGSAEARRFATGAEWGKHEACWHVAVLRGRHPVEDHPRTNAKARWHAVDPSFAHPVAHLRFTSRRH
jgi:hypothetical protein